MILSHLKPKTFNLKSNEGFIALTATIIVAAVLLILAVSVASSGFQSRFSVFDGEVKEVSRGLAEACVQFAILEYAKDNSYTGNNHPKTVVFDPDPTKSRECTIISVSGSAPALQIRTQAEFRSSFTNLEVVIDATNDYAVDSWEEVAEF